VTSARAQGLSATRAALAGALDIVSGSVAKEVRDNAAPPRTSSPLLGIVAG